MSGAQQFTYDVFISYSSGDKDWVRGELLTRIEQAGLKAFVDFRDFQPGAPSLKECERGVVDCRKTLLILTPNYLTSGWAEIENIMAQTHDPANASLRLIPLLRAKCEKPLRIGALTHIDFTDGADHELAWQKLIRSLRAVADSVNPVPANPFTPRGAITDPSQFFGRKNELRRIAGFLANGTPCSLVGPRRIGKSSLLRAVQRAHTEWPIAYVDLQDARCATLVGWLDLVGTQWGWRKGEAITLPAFADGVAALVQARGRVVLLLDEFEEFLPRKAVFHEDFFANLRAMVQDGLGIVTASHATLSHLTPRLPGSSFCNVFSLERVRHFPEADAAEFLAVERPGVEPFTAGEREQMLHFADGHPLALQVAADECQEGRGTRRRLDDSLRAAEEKLREMLPDGWRMK